MPGPFFYDKVAGLKPAALLENDSGAGVFQFNRYFPGAFHFKNLAANDERFLKCV